MGPADQLQALSMQSAMLDTRTKAAGSSKPPFRPGQMLAGQSAIMHTLIQRLVVPNNYASHKTKA